MAERLAEIDAARAALEALEAKIDRTAKQPGNLLAPVIRAEATYLRTETELVQERRRWELARQEVEVITCAIPF